MAKLGNAERLNPQWRSWGMPKGSIPNGEAGECREAQSPNGEAGGMPTEGNKKS
jgi:hypothetical protein